MDAEDVIHDVLLKILEKTYLNALLEYMAAYIYRSLKNRVIDYIRTRKSTLSLDGGQDNESGRLIDLLHDLRPNALALLQSREGKEELFAALEGLSEMEEEVIIAHKLEGVPFKELSQIWEIPQNTLLSHKARAMNKLRKHFLDS